MKTTMVVCLIASFLSFGVPRAAAQTLADLENKAKNQSQEFEPRLVIQRELREGINKLVQEDALQTPEEMRRAGMLLMDADTHKQPTLSTCYQLMLTALVLGDQEAAKQIGRAWDGLLMATGRYRRIGAVKMTIRVDKGDQWWVEPAPESIRKVYSSPTEAKRIANESKNNADVQRLVDADQKARGGDFSKFTQADIMKMMREDRERFHRIKQIVADGGLKTAQDFFNASLVCQHGEVFPDYALAHELAVCSVMLGKTGEAVWLAGASYDRMLLSAGYPQGFDTQFIGNWHLNEFSTEGMNDRMRKAVVHLTLAESQDREKHPPKG